MLQYALFDRLIKYFIAQIAENTFILHLKKKKKKKKKKEWSKQEYRTTLLRVKLN